MIRKPRFVAHNDAGHSREEENMEIPENKEKAPLSAVYIFLMRHI